MHFIFHGHDDLEDCLEVLREYVNEDRELAQELLLRLAGQIKDDLAQDVDPDYLEGTSDCLHAISIQRESAIRSDYNVALLQGLYEIYSCLDCIDTISPDEAINDLGPAFKEILLHQIQAQAFTLEMKAKKKRKKHSQGGKHRPAWRLHTLCDCIVREHPEWTAKEAWQHFAEQPRQGEASRANEKTTVVMSVSPDDNLIIFEKRTGKKQEVAFKTFQNALTNARKRIPRSSS